MDWQHAGECFHFHDDDILNKEIEPVFTIQCDALIDDRHTSFGDEAELTSGQLSVQTGGVSRFEQARTEHAVDFDCGRDYVAGYIVVRRCRQHADVISKTGTGGFCGAIR